MALFKDEEIIDTPDFGKIYKSKYDELVKSGDIREYRDDPNQGDFSRGVSSGTEGVKSSLFGAVGALGDAVGSDSLRDYGIQKARQSERFSGYYGNKDNYSIEGVDGVGSAIDYAQYQLGNAIPSLATSLVGGGVGAIGGKLLAKQAVKNEVDDLVKGQIAKSYVNRGLTAGLFGTSATLEGGQIYPDAYESNPDEALSNALVGGAVGGAIETVADKFLLGKFLGQGTTGNLGSRILKGAGQSFATEGTTETLQQANQRFFTDKDLTSDEALSEYANSFVAGGLVGGALGGVGGAFNKALSPEEIRQQENQALQLDNAESNAINQEISGLQAQQSSITPENIGELDLGGYTYNQLSSREDLGNLTQEDITKEKLNIRNKLIENGLSKDNVIKLSNSINKELQKNYVERKNNVANSTVAKEQLKTDVENIDGTIKNVKESKIIPADNTSITLIENIQNNTARVNELNNNKVSLSDNRTTIENNIKELDTQFSNINSNTELDTRINEVKSSIAKLNKDTENVNKIPELKKLKENLRTLTKEKVDFNKNIETVKSNLNSQKEQLSSQLVNLDNQLKTIDNETLSLNKSIEQDNKSYNEYIENQKNDIIKSSEIEKENLNNQIKSLDENIEVSNKEIEENTTKDESLLKDISDEQTISIPNSFLNTDNKIKELTAKEKVIDKRKFDNVSKEINRIKKQFNFNFSLKNSNETNYSGDVEGYYSNIDGSITIFYDKIKDLSRVKELALHELQHKGAYQRLKNKDLVEYKKVLDLLYENLNVKAIADELNTNLNDKYLSIEESVSKIAETVDFNKLTGYRKLINFVKELINKFLGKNYLQTDAQVNEYIIKNIDYALMNDAINSANDDTILFSRTFDTTNPVVPYTEQQNKEINDAVYKIVTSSTLENISKNKEKFVSSGSFTQDSMDNAVTLVSDVRNGVYTKGKIQRLVNSVTSFREKINDRNNPILNKLLHNSVDKFAYKLRFLNEKTKDRFINEIIDIIGKNNENLSEKEIIVIREMLAKIVVSQKKPDQQGLKYILDSDSRIINKDVGLNYMNKIFEWGANIVDTNATSDIFKIIKLILDSSDKLGLDNDIITQLRNLENEFLIDFDYNKLFEKVKLLSQSNIDPSTVISENGNKDKIVGSINNYLKSFDKILKDRTKNIERGYLPKDHSGKFVVRAYFIDAKNEKRYFLVDGSGKQEDANRKQDEYMKHFELLKASGSLPSNIKIFVENTERKENSTDSITPFELLTNLENAGVELTEEQKSQIFLTSTSIQNLKRNFTNGIGFNTNFESILNKQSNSYNSQMLRSMDSYSTNKLLNSLDRKNNPFDFELGASILERRSSVDDYTTLQAKMRGWASLWYLGFNPSSAVLQFTSMIPALSIWMGQYNNINSLSTIMSSIKTASKYIKDGTTGDIALDEAMKKFESDLLDVDNVKKIYTGRDDNNQFNKASLKDKTIENAFYLFSKVEKLNRVSNFVASYKMYQNREELNKTNKVKIPEDFNKFAIDNIIKVNGDYSAFNRPNILKGDNAQLILMYKYFFLVAYEMFKHLDMKDRAKFLGVLVLSSGFAGLPGYQDFEKIIDFFFKIFGIPFSLKSETTKFMDKVGENFGVDNFETYARSGVIPSLGARQGLGQILPFIGLLDLASNQTLDNTSASSIGGPAIGLAVKNVLGIGDIMQGSTSEGFKQLAPSALANVYKGVEALVQGGNVNKQGTALNTINSDGFTGYAENLGKIFGFQSPSEMNEYSKQGILADIKSTKKMISNSFRNDYLRAKFNGDNAEANEIFKTALEYNRQSKAAKDGYDIPLNRKTWDKSYLDSRKTISQRTLSKESKETQRTLLELGV